VAGSALIGAARGVGHTVTVMTVGAVYVHGGQSAEIQPRAHPPLSLLSSKNPVRQTGKAGSLCLSG